MKRSFSHGTMRRIGAIALMSVVAGSTAQTLYASTPSVMSAFTNALAGMKLFANPQTSARREADKLRGSRPDDAAMLERIASQPVATWIGGWINDVRSEIDKVTSLASRNGAVPVLVAYNIPNRDCGSYSAGGEKDAASYGRWIRDFAAGLSGRKAVVVLEPDALAQMNCLKGDAQDTRIAMIKDAVTVLKNGGATVYIDAGHPGWLKAADIAARLNRAAIAEADGFALNVSNFIGTGENVKYGEQISALVGGKHFIVDTGRNGTGGNGQWCNPRGQALGAAPTTRTGNSLADGFLWIKQPGESDGSCNGGPKAGQWWNEYALELARNSAQQVVAVR